MTPLSERAEPIELDPTRKRVASVRIEFRPQPDQKKLYEQAAALEGQTLTEFLIRSADERAMRVLKEHEAMHLNDASRERFVEMLTNAPMPTDRLRAAFERHNEEVESR